MVKHINTFRVKIGNETHVLHEKRSSLGSRIWVMFTEKDGVEMRGTRIVKSRLNRESKEFFNVKK